MVAWAIQHGIPGLENLALIPGTVGAAPVQNIGAYGLELQDRFHSLDAVDLFTGQTFTLDAAQCGFGYRDSVFKHPPAPGMGLQGRAVITHVRFALPKRWQPELGYLDLPKEMMVEARDMNRIPDDLTGFDFCWSACARPVRGATAGVPSRRPRPESPGPRCALRYIRALLRPPPAAARRSELPTECPTRMPMPSSSTASSAATCGLSKCWW